LLGGIGYVPNIGKTSSQGVTMAEPPGFLAHNEGDLVAVAVRDLAPGSVEGGYLRGPSSVRIDLHEEVPLGHKLALVDIAEGQDIIEYGQLVGIALNNIGKGSLVHVHNMRSARWRNSVA
jgi:(2R)-sulfolactate sulfo-lyase subunit alpha